MATALPWLWRRLWGERLPSPLVPPATPRLGLAPAGDNNDPTHVATVTRIFETCRSHGLAVGIHTWSEEYTLRYLRQGFQFVTLGADSGFMARMAAAELRSVRNALK